MTANLNASTRFLAKGGWRAALIIGLVRPGHVLGKIGGGPI